MNEEKLIFDCESGGFNAIKDGLCSVALKVFGKDVKENIFIKPNANLNYAPAALKVNGLNLKWLEENGITENEAIQKIKYFLKINYKNTPRTITQNGKFDIKFIESLFQRNNQGSFSELINYLEEDDTYCIAKRLRAIGKLNAANNKLGTLFTHFTGREPEDAHDAMGDVLMTEEVYLKEMELLEE